MIISFNHVSAYTSIFIVEDIGTLFPSLIFSDLNTGQPAATFTVILSDSDTTLSFQSKSLT
jgi:hypothetical protein